MTNITNQVPFLREQRLFPKEIIALTVEVDRAYTDIASSMNSRTIGVYTNNNKVQNGESWFLNGNKYQGFRRFYTFTSAGSIAHGLDISSIFAFTKIQGTFTNGTVWYPLPYVDTTAANNQVSVTVNATNIVITAGGGTPPTITQGYVVLEFLSLP